MEKAVKPKGETNLPQLSASALALYLLNFPHFSGILFPWKKKMKESHGCTKTVGSTASLGARSLFPLFQESHSLDTPALSSCLAQVNSHLTSQANVSTGKSHHLLRINFKFFSGNGSPKSERFYQEKMWIFVSLFCSEALWISLSRSKQMSSTTAHYFFFSKGNKNKKITVFWILKVTYISSPCPARHQIFKHLFFQTKAKSWAGNTVCNTYAHRSELGKAWFTFCLLGCRI